MNDVATGLDAWAAAEVRGDPAGFAPLLADDFTATGPLGFTLDRVDGRWRLVRVHMSFIAGTPEAPPLPGRP